MYIYYCIDISLLCVCIHFMWIRLFFCRCCLWAMKFLWNFYQFLFMVSAGWIYHRKILFISFQDISPLPQWREKKDFILLFLGLFGAIHFVLPIRGKKKFHDVLRTALLARHENRSRLLIFFISNSDICHIFRAIYAMVVIRLRRNDPSHEQQ